jgi:hypothetical protein
LKQKGISLKKDGTIITVNTESEVDEVEEVDSVEPIKSTNIATTSDNRKTKKDQKFSKSRFFDSENVHVFLQQIAERKYIFVLKALAFNNDAYLELNKENISYIRG